MHTYVDVPATITRALLNEQETPQNSNAHDFRLCHWAR
jgi:hypothetical protein